MRFHDTSAFFPAKVDVCNLHGVMFAHGFAYEDKTIVQIAVTNPRGSVDADAIGFELHTWCMLGGDKGPQLRFCIRQNVLTHHAFQTGQGYEHC